MSQHRGEVSLDKHKRTTSSLLCYIKPVCRCISHGRHLSLKMLYFSFIHHELIVYVFLHTTQTFHIDYCDRRWTPIVPLAFCICFSPDTGCMMVSTDQSHNYDDEKKV